MLTLHAHSNYSLMQGTIRIDELIAFAKEQGSRYAALTDTNGMYGSIQFAKKAEEEGLKPVLGALVNDPNDQELFTLLFAKNNEGYSELCKIITSRKLDDDFSLLQLFEDTNFSNLFVVTSSIKLLKSLKIDPLLRRNLFVELIATEAHKGRSRELYEFSKQNNLQIVATHPAYFLKPEDYLLHKTVVAIGENLTLANLDSDKIVDEEFHLKDPQELRKIWRGLPEAVWNAEYIAENCSVDLEFKKYKFPSFPLPYSETPFSHLWKVAFRGLEERYRPITDQAVKRLQHELEVIEELGFCDYFLIVWDIVREAKKRGMMTLGRGSAANSLVSYCLGFTDIDPLEQNLYFERFLNRGRLSPPDVDLDFSWKERDEIVKYVYEKYGYDRVAMISTMVTFRARSAFRETAKVFGIANSEISKYSKFIPWTSAHNLPELAKKFPEARSLKFEDEPWKSIIKIATKLAGFPRHLSIHPGGIVITEEPMTNYVPLEYAKNKGLGLIVTQPDMYPIEDMGLIKIDLLSQRSLGVLRDTLGRLKQDEGKAPKGKPNIFDIRDKS
jgi:DNA polymerase III alpha subunit